MNSEKPIKLKYGNTNTYLVGKLLVDTDMAGTLQSFRRELKKTGIPSEWVEFVFVTHFHPDHMGLAGELMQSGVKLILLSHQIKYVHSYDSVFSRDRHSAFVPVDEKNAIIIPVEESRVFLSKIGIKGEIVVTKSHSPDGAALILDDGTAFVGDVEPREFLGGYDDNRALCEDWETILSHGVETVCYGHANEQIISKNKKP